MDYKIGPVFWTRQRTQVAIGLVLLYLVWGSTYLGIRLAVESLPPLIMAGGRWLISGALLYLFALRREKGSASLRRALVAGTLLIGLGNGAVSWAETRVASGPAALVVATVSLWMVLTDWALPGGARPSGRVLLGVALGLCGVALLHGTSGRLDAAGLSALLLAALGWAIGASFLRRMPPATAPLKGVALQMLVGGALLSLSGLVRGEGAHLVLAQVTARSLWGVALLVVLGSLVGYTLFQWLLGQTSPAVVGTYGCVNPVVAVLLGWLFLGEPVGARTALVTVLIMAGVALVLTRGASVPARVLPLLGKAVRIGYRTS